MAAVLVIMAVMAILLTVAVQTVTFHAKREKEEELIFRGTQAVEAIRLFRARNGRFPLSLDELVQAKPRVLRKVWADPITGKPDWMPVFLGEDGQAVAGGGQQPQPQPTPSVGGLGGDAPRGGPIVGVRSRSCAESIKVYNGRTRYCDWKFVLEQRPQQQGGTPQPTPGR